MSTTKPLPLQRPWSGGSNSAPKLVIVQHSVRFALEERYGDLVKTRTVRQGDNALSFYQAME